MTFLFTDVEGSTRRWEADAEGMRAALSAHDSVLGGGRGVCVSAFDHLTLAIRGFHNAGDTMTLRSPLAILAVLFDRLGRCEPAATIAEFALSPLSASAVPEIDHRDHPPPRCPG